MITLTTTILIILISTFFAIFSGYLDATIINLRNATKDYKVLAHNSRMAMRGVFYFFLSILAYLPFASMHESHPDLFALLFLIGGSAFYAPFNIIINKARNKKWNYLGEDSKIDRFLYNRYGNNGMAVGISVSCFVMIVSAIIFYINY